MRIDELNTPVTKYEYSDFASYYEPMQITKEQKEKRTETAHDLWYVFLMFFTMLSQGVELGDLDYAFILSTFRNRFGEVAIRNARDDAYIQEYIETLTTEVMDTTWSRMSVADPDDYWLSEERASILALNESNSINNYEDLQKAIENGYSYKVWKAEIDSRTRKTHFKMDGMKVPIDGYFEFPDCKMIAPHDVVNGTAKELSNCRCSLKYERE